MSENAVETPSTLTVTVPLRKVLACIRVCNDWFKMKQDNQSSPLGRKISKVADNWNIAAVKYNNAVTSFRDELDAISNKYADYIEITENTQIPNHAVVVYKFKGGEGGEMDNNLTKRNNERKQRMDYFALQEKEMLDEEVTVEVSYVEVTPASNLLPNDMKEAMMGFVIKPDDRKVFDINGERK